MEISLVLTNDSGSYQAILGQFIATSIAETAADRAAADADAASALASAASATASASSATASASTATTQAGIATTQAGNAATSATAASGSASAASTSAGNASTSATNAASSATAASGSASAAATSASNAAATLANALVKANNLSDVNSASLARSNLGLGALATLSTAPVANGGTGVTTASGTALDNIAGFSFTGYMKRTGAGAYTAVATIPITDGGTGATTAAAARTALGAAASGANSDVTSLSGLTTALSVGQGGTGSNAAGGARSNLGAAASGANSDITSITGLTGGITAPPSNALPITVGGAERARIDTTGALHVNETSAWSSGAVSARNYAAQPWGISSYASYQTSGGCYLGRVDSSTTPFAAWFFGTTSVGSISTNGTTTTYGTTSDYRLKQNVVDLSGDDAVAMIRAGRPVRYTFISDDTNAPHIGFIADAYQAIQPEAVTGVKDDMGISMTPRFDDNGNIILDANGNPIYDTVPRYQTLDYGKPTPILWAALKRALDRIDALEVQVAALLPQVQA